MKKGFTLIETIIYIGLLSVLLIGLVNSSYTLLSNFNRHDNDIFAIQEGDFIIGKIRYLLLGADVVYIPVLNATSTTLSLKNNGITYDIDAKIFASDLIEVKDFVVEHGKSGNAPAWVKVSFSINKINFSVIRYTRL
ncbi:MAG: prepilin-type N-terminal cleavage/methylation domain-containing protein [Patescibacteria group bacterium]|nr:prepilin-type N-terminal cleavage/methylation domain-containing protein [Patescibacteria group bacterium]